MFTAVLALDKKLAITASTDHLIRVWDIQAKCRLKVLSGHSDIVV